jgi:hypothetical protein
MFLRHFVLRGRSSALWCHWHVIRASWWMVWGVRYTVLLFRAVGNIFSLKMSLTDATLQGLTNAELNEVLYDSLSRTSGCSAL